MSISQPNCILCHDSHPVQDLRASFLLNLAVPFSVMRCPVCSLRWLNPMPTSEEYAAVYNDRYFAPNQTERSSWAAEYANPPSYEDCVVPERITAFRARLTRIQTWIAHPGTALDIGLASGEFVYLAQQYGWIPTGIDISARACRLALDKYGVNAICGDFLALDFKEKRFDLIHLNHVFEHLTDPQDALDRIGKLMHANSLLVLEVPNQFDSWVRRLVNLVRSVTGSPQMERTLSSIHHPFFYNHRTLPQLLERHGFKVLALRTHFPERWQNNFRRRLLGGWSWIADKLAHSGDDIEIIARYANAVPIPRNDSAIDA